MQPTIRHCIDLKYDVHLGDFIAMLDYHNLSLNYIEEEIHEGSRGALPVTHSEVSLKVPGKFGESTLYFKEAESRHYEYDFVLWTDLSMLKTSKEGKELMKKAVLPYNKIIKPSERKQVLQKKALLGYISSHTASSFEVDFLRALGLMHKYPVPKASDKVKKEFLDTLVKEIKKEFLNALAKELYQFKNNSTLKYVIKKFYINNKFQTKHIISLHGGYLYEAFEKIIQEYEK